MPNNPGKEILKSESDLHLNQVSCIATHLSGKILSPGSDGFS